MKKIVCCAVLMLLIVLGGKAQSQPPKKEEKGAELTALQVRSMTMLEQTGREAALLEDRRQAARLQALAADAVWPLQKELARRYFAEAFQIADEYYRQGRDDNRQKVGEDSWVSRNDVRLEIVRMINLHDSEMGREYTDKYIESRKQEGQKKAGDGRRNSMSQFFGGNAESANDLLRAAESLMEKDPKLAIEIARRSIAQGVTPNLSGFLLRLGRRERAAADGLFVMALDRMRAEQAPLPGQLLSLSAYAFGSNMVEVSDGGSTSMWGFGPARRDPKDAPDPRVTQRFLAASLEILGKASEPAILQLPDGASRLATAFFAAKSFAPKVAEFMPALNEQWQGLIGKIGSLTADNARQGIDQRLQDPARQKQNDSEDGFGAGPDPQSLADRAQNARDPGERDELYAQAAINAARQGKGTEAFDYTGKINDLTLRQKIKSWISYEAANKAIQQKKLDEARRYAMDVEETDQRAYLFVEIARAAFGDQDRVRVRELLEEALLMAGKADETPGKVRSLLGLIDLYRQVDFNRAFEIAEYLVKTINKVAADQLQPGEDSAMLLRSLETKSNSMVMANNVEGFDSDRVFAGLAQHDFERAINLALAIDQLPYRYSTLIAVAGKGIR